jgi:hypothetical protein
MRIIGGKDYYDSGLSFGVDESVIFVRKSFDLYDPSIRNDIRGNLPEFKLHDKAYSSNSVWNDSYLTYTWEFDDLNYHVEAVSIFFCGKIYKGIRVYWEHRTRRFYGNKIMKPLTGGTVAKRNYGEVRQETFWDMNSFNKWAAKNGITIDTTKRSSLRGERPASFSIVTLESDQLTPYLSKGIVVATAYGGQEKITVRNTHRCCDDKEIAWVCNSDNLKEFDFIKVVDPTTAFQNISMWIGGVIPKPGNRAVEITDDKIKIAKHGMDKYSFRKHP